VPGNRPDGQATSESIGDVFYSGVGGHQDFMRGALLARHGKTILAMKSTAGKTQSPASFPL